MASGPSVTEAVGNQGQMSSTLRAGVETLDLQQTVTFTLYQRVVLPADGFVFWVKADQLSPSALANRSPLNTTTPNQPLVTETPALTFEASGSLHHTTINRQDPDESFSTHRMVFTSLQPVNDLALTSPDHLYLATTDGEQYAFSTRSGWYRQAGLYHYSGDAVYPSLATQIVNHPSELNLQQVVSNSLPLWLTFNQLFPVYPAFLVPDNIKPPYAAVSIDENDTHPMQAGPFFDREGNRWQLARDSVRVVTYGVRNDTILDWLDLVSQYTLDNPSVLGVMNSPVPRESKRGQAEISTLAQKKLIEIEASYYQSRLNSVVLQTIKSAFIEDFIVNAEILVA